MKKLRGKREERAIEGTRSHPPQVDIAANVQIKAGGQAWRTAAQRIYEYLRGEMGDAEDQRKRIYEKTWESQIQRTVPLIWRMARERSTLYLRAAYRELFDDNDEPITGDGLKAMRREYKRMKVDRRLRTAQEHLSALQNATVWVWLTATGYRLLTPPIHDQWVTVGRIDGQDVDDVIAWRIRFPVIADPFARSVPTAMALITRDRAIWESGPEGWEGVGIWEEDGSNPFGRIPVMYLRGCDPAPGEFLVPVQESNLDAQRAANHDYTDQGTIARKDGYAQAYVKGLTQTQALEMETGPETVIGIPAEGDFGYANPKADLSGYALQLDAFLKMVIACSGLSPQAVMKSIGTTGQAKRVENQQAEVETQRDKDEFESGEQQLYELIQLATKIRNGGVDVLPAGATMRVTHRQPIMPADPLADAEAKKMRIEMLIDSVASVIAEERAISLEDAQVIAQKNLKLQRELGTLPEEFDETVTTTPKPADGETTATPEPAESVETQTPAPSEGSPPNLAAGGEVQKAALNGAQVAELRGTIQAVADGLLPAGTARAIILAAYPISGPDVDAMLSPLDGFEAKKPAAPRPFGAPPQQAPEVPA